jgi:hypothetical protein
MLKKLICGAAIAAAMAIAGCYPVRASYPTAAANSHVSEALDSYVLLAERSSSKGRPHGWAKARR